MKKSMLLLLFQFLNAITYGQFTVSENKHFVLRDGKPFFWLADTGWELFHRLNREQADDYLKRRAAQGFTVIQAVVLAEFDGLHTANPYGDLPLLIDDPTKPNDAYFRHVDYIINKAEEYNLVIGLLPTWGDKVFKNTWGAGPEVFTTNNAKIYGKWLSERYKTKKNIIWIIGGDRNPQNETHIAIWRNMAQGIIDGAGASTKPMISFHPQPNTTGSAEWFHQDSWLSFNMFQNGHCRNTEVYSKIQTVYKMLPLKPVLDAEPLYEDHPVCFNATDLGTSNAYDIRLYAYLSLFAGAFGHTYGCHDIWQFYSPNYLSVNNPHVFWQQAIDLPGANQMKFVKRLILSRPFLERVPDQSLIVEDNNAFSERVQATRGKDYAFIYAAAGSPFSIHPGKITGTKLNVSWYNPRNGEVKKQDAISNNIQHKFIPPTSGYGQDWVLILDDASKNFPMPLE